MGYDTSRFEGSVDDELTCPICTFVLQDAVQAPDCEHTFCNVCINEWLLRNNSCPVDRQPITRSSLKPAPRVLRNFLAKLDIKCDFSSGGCPVVTKLELLQSHTDCCDFNPFKPVACDKGCGLVLLRNEVDSHNCLSDLRELVSKQIKIVNDLKATKDGQDQRMNALSGILKKVTEVDLMEAQKTITTLQRDLQRVQSQMDSLNRKMTQQEVTLQSHQSHITFLSRESGNNDTCDQESNEYNWETCDACDLHTLPLPPPSTPVSMGSQSVSGRSKGLKRIHCKGKDFPAPKRMPDSGKPYGSMCHSMVPSASSSDLMMDGDLFTLRHNHCHTTHSHSHFHHGSNAVATASPGGSSGSNGGGGTQMEEGGTSCHPDSRFQLITFYGKVFSMNIQSDDTVGQLKRKIHLMEGLDMDQMQLSMSGLMLEDDKTVTSYAPSSTTGHMTLRLRDGMKIMVKTLSDKMIEVSTDPNETIELVKVKIHEQEAISPCDQRLLKDGRDLENLRTLSDYGIRHKTKLTLDLQVGSQCPICQTQFQAHKLSASSTSTSTSSSSSSSSSNAVSSPSSPSTSGSGSSTSGPSRSRSPKQEKSSRTHSHSGGKN